MSVWVIYSNNLDISGVHDIKILGILNSKTEAVREILSIIKKYVKKRTKENKKFIKELIHDDYAFADLEDNSTWADIRPILKNNLLTGSKCCYLDEVGYSYQQVNYNPE